jgi:hypothetical protein
MKGSDPKTLGHNSCFFYFCEGHYGTIIMARPVRITKDRILAAALDIVRRGGSGSLTARSLSAALGCGANALFTSFGSIQGIRDAVKAEARGLYQSRVSAGFSPTRLQRIRHGLPLVRHRRAANFSPDYGG